MWAFSSAPTSHTRFTQPQPNPTHPSYGEIRGRLMIAPVLGCPGIGRFVDVRTAWLDEALAGALKGPAPATQVVVIAAGGRGGGAGEVMEGGGLWWGGGA
jgi:hypothetical protein